MLPGCLGEPPRLSPPAALAELGERESPVSDVRCLSRLGRLGRLGPEPPQTSQTSEALPTRDSATPHPLPLTHSLTATQAKGESLEDSASSALAVGSRVSAARMAGHGRCARRRPRSSQSRGVLTPAGFRRARAGSSRAGPLAEARAQIMRSAIGAGAYDGVAGAQGCWCSACTGRGRIHDRHR